jgi:hypothetical protein
LLISHRTFVPCTIVSWLRQACRASLPEPPRARSGNHASKPTCDGAFVSYCAPKAFQNAGPSSSRDWPWRGSLVESRPARRAAAYPPPQKAFPFDLRSVSRCEKAAECAGGVQCSPCETALSPTTSDRSASFEPLTVRLSGTSVCKLMRQNASVRSALRLRHLFSRNHAS